MRAARPAACRSPRERHELRLQRRPRREGAAAGAGALAEAKAGPAAKAATGDRSRTLELYASQVRPKAAAQRAPAEPVAAEDLLPCGAGGEDILSTVLSACRRRAAGVRTS